MQGKIDGLTSLRFFAAMMIVALHAKGHFGIPAQLPNQIALGAGVSIFFVLSGFILTYRYPELPDRRSVLIFWRRRIARLWPVHIAAMALMLWTMRGRHLLDWDVAAHLVLNVTMVQTWVPLHWFAYSFNEPSWSIATEFFFYMIFPLLIADFARSWWWKLALTLAAALAIAALCDHFQLAHGDLNAPTGTFVLLTQFPLARLFEFVLGMCAAMFLHRFAAKVRLNLAAATLVEATALGALALVLVVWGWEDTSNALSYWWHSSARFALPAAMLIFVLGLHQGLLSRVLSLPPLVLGGEISYAIYLVHYPLLVLYGRHYDAVFSSHPVWLLSAGFFAILFGLSWLIYAAIERPFRALISGASFRTSRAH